MDIQGEWRKLLRQARVPKRTNVLLTDNSDVSKTAGEVGIAQERESCCIRLLHGCIQQDLARLARKTAITFNAITFDRVGTLSQ